MEVVPEEQERLRPRLTRLGCGLAVVGLVAMALSTSTTGERSREQPAAQLVAAVGPTKKADTGLGGGQGVPPKGSAASPSESTSLPIKRPNIVFVMLDDVGYNDFGYGSTDLGSMTPYLDGLADDGIKFGQLYGMHVCTPSRAALLSGKYPIHLQLEHWQIAPQEPWGLPTDVLTMPQIIKRFGYKTIAVGKWHLGNYNNASLPLQRGFDNFFGFYSGGLDYFTKMSPDSCDDGGVFHNGTTACYVDFWREDQPAYDVVGSNATHTTELLNEYAINAIEENAVSKLPLFLYMAYPNAHVPLQTPKYVRDKYAAKLDEVPNADRRAFAALMLQADDAVNNLTAALQREMMYDFSMMIVCSDNGGLISSRGGGSNWPLRGEKKYLWEGGVRVQGFLHSPMLNSKRRGVTYEHMFHMVDFMPTILEGMLGRSNSSLEKFWPQYALIDGINHWDAIVLGEKYDDEAKASGTLNPHEEYTGPRNEMLYNIDYLSSKNDYLGYFRAALRVGNWKLVWNEQNISWYEPPTTRGYHVDKVHISGRITALYNLSADPNERFDLKDEQPGQVKLMVAKLLHQYLPSMTVSNYRDADARAYEKWDRNDKFVGPWLADNDTFAEYHEPARRQIYEDEFFNSSTSWYKQLNIAQDDEMSSWVSFLGDLELKLEGQGGKANASSSAATMATQETFATLLEDFSSRKSAPDAVLARAH
jgi:arylsulfatase A-like enzyme